MNTSLLYPRVTATRRVVSLDGMWKFQFDPEYAGEAAGWTAGLPAPCSMPVPSSFCDIFTTKDEREYAGDFWYETDFLVPGEWKGQEVVIRFGSVTHKAKVFLNGEAFLLPQPERDAAYTVDGNVISFSLGHGETLTIPYIPIGAVVVVEEHSHAGFEVSSKYIGTDEPAVPGSCREIMISNAVVGVEFINQSGYRLPNTGGNVSYVYTTGCAALCAGFGAAVLYHFVRRKEEDASS